MRILGVGSGHFMDITRILQSAEKLKTIRTLGATQNWAAMGETTALPVLPAVFGSFLITVASALLAVGTKLCTCNK